MLTEALKMLLGIRDLGRIDPLVQSGLQSRLPACQHLSSWHGILRCPIVVQALLKGIHDHLPIDRATSAAICKISGAFDVRIDRLRSVEEG